MGTGLWEICHPITLPENAPVFPNRESIANPKEIMTKTGHENLAIKQCQGFSLRPVPLLPAIVYFSWGARP